jgi:hypothetical protein
MSIAERGLLTSKTTPKIRKNQLKKYGTSPARMTMNYLPSSVGAVRPLKTKSLIDGIKP